MSALKAILEQYAKTGFEDLFLILANAYFAQNGLMTFSTTGPLTDPEAAVP